MGRRKANVADKVFNLDVGGAQVQSIGPMHRPLEQPRRLLTLGPDSEVWNVSNRVEYADLINGAIMRLIPPADATDSKIEEVRLLAITNGAVAIKILPRQQIGTLGKATDGSSDSLSALDLRKAVHVVAERMNSADKAALKCELDSVMDEVGL